MGRAECDEILRLEARIKRLEEALRPFVLFELGDKYDDDSLLDIIVSFGDLRNARAALEDK